MQVAARDEWKRACERPVRIGRERVNLIESAGEGRIRAQIRGDLLGAGLIDTDSRRLQCGVCSLEPVLNFRPTQRLLTQTDLSKATRGHKHGEQPPRPWSPLP